MNMILRALGRAALALATCGAVAASAQNAQTVPGAPPAAVNTDPARAQVTLPEPANPALPTLFLIGDSTVRNGRDDGQGKGAEGQWGWGNPIATYFEPGKINVVNRAVGGLSSRTYISSGHWQRTLALVRQGDVVVMQFGHNDSGMINDTSRARGTIKGIGDESQEIDNLLTKGPETVHSYGWYLRRYVADIRAKGATPIICSPIPHKSWGPDGKVVRGRGDYAGWAADVARQEHVGFIDLNEQVARKYDELGRDQVMKLFPMVTPDEHTHTNLAGAELNARAVMAGIKALRAPVLVAAMSARARDVVQAEDERPVVDAARVKADQPRDPALPSIFIVGDSTVRSGGTNGAIGWGERIAPYFDAAKVNVVNHAIGGRSSRTFYTEGRWDKVLAQMKAGDVVLIQFGHNDGGRIGDPAMKGRASGKGTGPETVEDTKADGSKEQVHTFGWYMAKYVADAKARGASVVLLSPVPHKDAWEQGRDFANFAQWDAEVAQAGGAQFADLTMVISEAYRQAGAATVQGFFSDARTHTNDAGAQFNAQRVVGALKALPGNPVAAYLSGQGQAVPPAAASSQAGASLPEAVDGTVALRWLGDSAPALQAGVSWGVPWPRGSVSRDQVFTLKSADGKSLPLQSWPLAYWPDGTLKWTGFATVAAANAVGPLQLVAARGPITGAADGAPVITIAQKNGIIDIDTGAVKARVRTSGSNLIDSLSIAGREVARAGQLVVLSQNGTDVNEGPAPRREKFIGQIRKVVVEQSGPVRAVLKIDGVHQARTGSRAWLPFTVRLYFYAGQESIRMVHTMIYDGNQERDFIRGVGLSFAVPMREQSYNRHVRFSGQDGGLWAEPIQPGAGNAAQVAGERIDGGRFYAASDSEQYAIWSDYKLTQPTPDGFTIQKRTNAQSSWVFSGAGKRASGLAFVGDTSGGLAVSIKDFWQSYPSGLEVTGAAKDTAQLTAWLWSPDAAAMDMRHYATRAHGLTATYEDVQAGMSKAYGVARTSELTIYPTGGVPAKAATVAMAKAGEQQPLLAASPAYIHASGVLGVWSLPDHSTPLKAAMEQRLDSMLAFYKQQVDERYWYGFWYYGDFIHSYNNAGHVWYYDYGGHAWDNTELGTPLWLWTSFLRTGRADVFRMAEALTRNTSETNVYHIGPMAGLGSRHNVVKWGDGAKEARISQSAHWRPYYYLTTDERTGDIMREQLKSDLAAMKHDPMRLAQPVLPQDPKYPGRIRIGPDWFVLAGNWMTEWERSGDPVWRDRINAGVDAILAMPYWLRSGVRNGLNPNLGGAKIGPLKGGGSMTVGYDPASGKLFPIPDPVEHKQVPVNYNLATIQGGAQVMFELVPLLGREDWSRAWLQYSRLGGAPAEVLDKDRVTGIEGANAEFVESAQGGPRLAAYAYAQTRNPAYAKRAVAALARYRGADQRLVGGADSLNPVHEAAGVSTNDAAQSGLSIIEILALCGDALPNELPPVEAPPARRAGQ
jgi:lysophospholipase L1-like esterase